MTGNFSFVRRLILQRRSTGRGECYKVHLPAVKLSQDGMKIWQMQPLDLRRTTLLWRTPAHAVKSPFIRRLEIGAEAVVKLVHGYLITVYKSNNFLLTFKFLIHLPLSKSWGFRRYQTSPVLLLQMRSPSFSTTAVMHLTSRTRSIHLSFPKETKSSLQEFISRNPARHNGGMETDRGLFL